MLCLKCRQERIPFVQYSSTYRAAFSWGASINKPSLSSHEHISQAGEKILTIAASSEDHYLSKQNNLCNYFYSNELLPLAVYQFKTLHNGNIYSCAQVVIPTFKEIVHTKIKLLSSIAHPYVIPKL